MLQRRTHVVRHAHGRARGSALSSSSSALVCPAPRQPVLPRYPQMSAGAGSGEGRRRVLQGWAIRLRRGGGERGQTTTADAAEKGWNFWRESTPRMPSVATVASFTLQCQQTSAREAKHALAPALQGELHARCACGGRKGGGNRIGTANLVHTRNICLCRFTGISARRRPFLCSCCGPSFSAGTVRRALDGRLFCGVCAASLRRGRGMGDEECIWTADSFSPFLSLSLISVPRALFSHRLHSHSACRTHLPSHARQPPTRSPCADSALHAETQQLSPCACAAEKGKAKEKGKERGAGFQREEKSQRGCAAVEGGVCRDGERCSEKERERARERGRESERALRFGKRGGRKREGVCVFMCKRHVSYRVWSRQRLQAAAVCCGKRREREGERNRRTRFFQQSH